MKAIKARQGFLSAAQEVCRSRLGALQTKLGRHDKVTVLGCPMREAISGFVMLVCGVSSGKTEAYAARCSDLRLRQAEQFDHVTFM